MPQFTPSDSDQQMYGPLLDRTVRFEHRPKLSKRRPPHPGYYDRYGQYKSHPITYSDEQHEFCIAYWRGNCCVCGALFQEMDHWIPIMSRNYPGETVTNMLPMCMGCNRGKMNKEPRQWVRDHHLNHKAILKRIDDYFKLASLINWR